MSRNASLRRLSIQQGEPARRLRIGLFASTAFVAIGFASAALANGGAGGFFPGDLPNPGGTTNDTAAGGAGGSANGVRNGGGGGGAGTTGGSGGRTPGALGGSGGNENGSNGADGGLGVSFNGGGGGGGGAHGRVVSGETGGSPADSRVEGVGGNGGAGGAGREGNGTAGGGGGAGAHGVVVTGSGSIVPAGNVQGGNGGAGGASFVTTTGGSGGDGGNGLVFTGDGAKSVSILGTVSGGSGGAGGASGTSSGTTAGAAGLGGVGIVGSDLTLTVLGNIAGGFSGNGIDRSDAIRFESGVNAIRFGSAASLSGDIAIEAGTLALSAATNRNIGSVIKGAGGLIIDTTSPITFSATNTYSGGTVLAGGTLRVSSDANLGEATGTLTFRGGTLAIAASDIFSSSRAVVLDAGGGTIDVVSSESAPSTFTGVFSGAGGLTKRGAGELILEGANTYSGATIVSGGVLTIESMGSLASAVTVDPGVVLRNRGLISGAIDSSGFFDQREGSFTGGLTNRAGARAFLSGGSVAGGIANSGFLVVTGDVEASGDLRNEGFGRLVFGGDGAGTITGLGALVDDASIDFDSNAYSVEIAGNGSSVSTDTFGGDNDGSRLRLDGKLSVVGAGSHTYAGSIVGSGTLNKSGTGTLTLAGADFEPFSGLVDVSNGKLEIDGRFGDFAALLPPIFGPQLPPEINRALMNVSGSGIFAGTGTFGGSVNVSEGGTIAPGSALAQAETLTVNGDVLFDDTSTFAVLAAANGEAGRLDVGGTATLGGAGVLVTAFSPEASYVGGQRYTILSAGTRVGEFSGARLANDSAFLTSTLAYEGNSVLLRIATIDDEAGEPPVGTPPTGPGEPPVTPSPQPAPLFRSVAETPNQFATAGALNTLAQSGESLALFNAILFSNAPNARAAFDQLSGETHASVLGALAETSGAARDAVASRIETLFGVVAEGADLPVAEDRFLASGVWVDGFGTFGRADGNGNAANADRDHGGVFFGADRAVSPNATLGLFGGYSHASIDARNGSADVDTAHVGGYGAAAFGAVEVSGGAAYAWNFVDTTRTVAFPGFTDRLEADYDAGTAQVFGEIGYRAQLGGLGLKPFVSLAYVHVDADGFTESGGAARLTSGGTTDETVFTTVGLRATRELTLGGRLVEARGMVGWRHAEGDTNPARSFGFVTGSPFTVEGAPISRDAAVIEAGFSTEIVPNVSLGLDYRGQFGDDGKENGFRIGLSARF